MITETKPCIVFITNAYSCTLLFISVLRRIPDRDVFNMKIEDIWIRDREEVSDDVTGAFNIILGAAKLC